MTPTFLPLLIFWSTLLGPFANGDSTRPAAPSASRDDEAPRRLRPRPRPRRVERLMESLREIFEIKLKPRLEQLPTRAQRQAVEPPHDRP